jgi:hypothetical protein
MIILDTDHISLLQHSDNVEGQRLIRRLAVSSDPDIVTTVITVEEQMRGWLQVIARYRNPEQQSAYYDKLVEFVRFFGKWEILPFRESAVQAFSEAPTDACTDWHYGSQNCGDRLGQSGHSAFSELSRFQTSTEPTC